MKEKTLLTVSLITSLAGILILVLYAGRLDLNAVQRMDTVLPEENVVVKGSITRLSQQENVAFVELEGQRMETLNVVIFTDEELYLQEGDYVEITGTKEEYNGKQEVIASKVVKR